MGNKCGGIREACISDTDPRYDPDADFDFISQDELWSRITGLVEFEGTMYSADGSIKDFEEINLEGRGLLNVSGRNKKIYSNFTIDGTRSVYSSLLMYGPAYPSSNMSIGFAFAGSAYGTSTFELDGRSLRSNYQFVLQGNNWTDGPIETTYVVSDKATYASAAGSQRQARYSLVTTCLNEECDQRTAVQQVYQNNKLRDFTVYRGSKVDDESDFLGRIEATMEDFRIPSDIRVHTAVLSNPHMPPTETYWCDVLNDPSCTTSPYQNPQTSLKPGALVGFIVLAVVLVAALVGVVIMLVKKRQASRYRNVFARRVAQTIKVRVGAERLTAELLQKEFETIGGENNGFIKKEDLWTFLSTGKAGVIGKSDFEALWAVMDADDSGTIDFLEFCSFLAGCQDEYNTAKDRKSVISERASQLLTVNVEDFSDDGK